MLFLAGCRGEGIEGCVIRAGPVDEPAGTGSIQIIVIKIHGILTGGGFQCVIGSRKNIIPGNDVVPIAVLLEQEAILVGYARVAGIVIHIHPVDGEGGTHIELEGIAVIPAMVFPAGEEVSKDISGADGRRCNGDTRQEF